jgi:dipeptidase
MCDTFVAAGSATRDGGVIFAKNSDRDPNEAQEICLVPRRQYPADSEVECTYISIPQIRETNAILLSKPFWIWGAEMGANEHGVAIGNEALFTRVKQTKEPSLIGMDYLRLALERAATAREALDVITGLLSQYGQAGNCGFSHPFTYDNSYLLADPHEAWVLETAGREWAAVKVDDIRSISNAITIDREWDLASSGLVDYAVDQKWCRNRADFSFRDCYTEPVVTLFANARGRQQCTTSALQAEKGRLTLESMISILRSHTGDRQQGWKPDQAIMGADVCMHYGFGPIRINQTTGSMVSELRNEGSIHLLTGTAAPCTSIFKPVWVDIPNLDCGPEPTGKFDEETLWWRHELLHRYVLRDYPSRLASYRDERNALEAKFIAQARELRMASPEIREKMAQDSFSEAADATKKWTDSFLSKFIQNPSTFYTKFAWNKINIEAEFPK